MRDYAEIAESYCKGVEKGVIVAGDDVVNAVARYRADMDRDDLCFDESEPTATMAIMEATFCHRQGQALDGTPLTGTPLSLEPWEVFIVWNLLGFKWKSTGITRYTEGIVEIARKNGKTMLISALAWALSIRRRASGAKGYIVANSGDQSKEAFDNIAYNVRRMGLDKSALTLHDSFNQRAVMMRTPKGGFELRALKSNPKAQDSFNCNFAICDEFAGYKEPGQYNRFKEAMKAYRDKLIVGITTAGDSENSFGYRKIKYAADVAAGRVKDDSLFAFLCRPDLDDKGECDYMDPCQQAMANPNIGVTIDPAELMRDATVAFNDPQERKDFLSRSMNVYTAAKHAWFDLGEFRASDSQYDWKLEELAKMGIDWYGGADLSRMHDLTAAALYGHYDADGNDVDIVITHAWFPITQAAAKADEDSIPLFGWKDDGWLTMCNSDTVQYLDVVKWFEDMRDAGFRIRQVGFDRKFATEWVQLMEAHRFKVIDQPQYFWRKSSGFRHIEKAAKDGRLYYLHSDAYEYCVGNVHAVEKTDDMVEYHKVDEHSRMDLFDASVFACCKYIDQIGREKKAASWFGN